MSRKIRLGLVGCGRAGVNHLDAARQVAEVEVAAVCDRRADVAAQTAQRYGVAHGYASLEQMLQGQQLDAISVVTSLDSHYQVVSQALEAGLDVMCEKPLTLEAQQSQDLAALARRRERLLAVTYTYRFVPDMQRIKAIIDSGAIGSIREMRFTNYSGGPSQAPPAWRDHLFRHCKGIIYDCGCHAFDLFHWFSGHTPLRIHAWGEFDSPYDYPHHATAFLEFPGGIRALYDYGQLRHFCLRSNQASQTQFNIAVSGMQGSITWEFGMADPAQGSGSRLTLWTAAGPAVESFPIYGKHRQEQYQQFARGVIARALPACFPTLEEAVAATQTSCRVIDATRESRSDGPLDTLANPLRTQPGPINQAALST